MRKALLTIPLAILMAVMLASPAQAISFELKVEPKKIWPGESTTITFTCDRDAVVYVEVEEPDGDWWYIEEIILHGPPYPVSVSVKFPKDPMFEWESWDNIDPYPSTEDLGQYYIWAEVWGVVFWAEFYVSFFVIPELPFGTVMALVAPLAAVGLAKVKRSRLKR